MRLFNSQLVLLIKLGEKLNRNSTVYSESVVGVGIRAGVQDLHAPAALHGHAVRAIGALGDHRNAAP